MFPRLAWVALIVGSLLGNGCARPQRVPTPGESIDGKLVLLEHGSGDVIKGYVRSTTDSTVVLVPEPDRLIGHTDSIVVHVDDVSSVRVLGTHPLQYVTTGIVVSFVALLVYVALVVRDVPLGGGS